MLTLDVALVPTAIWLLCAVTVLPMRFSAAELFTAVVRLELADALALKRRVDVGELLELRELGELRRHLRAVGWCERILMRHLRDEELHECVLPERTAGIQPRERIRVAVAVSWCGGVCRVIGAVTAGSPC